ncbi:SRPBCC family protein [Zhongshania sp.]|uniref:SRPBCC family protein n=1 Tax=Zhongshania sp. TaxID=1971902 RepID=UPI001B6E91C4|nr:SRPBCC family protein [Zhongshania sp.]MBQ0795326.1 SRPBCC family protein [Zhongshania sp.]|tara:strand:- start:10382 stop:10807 length:426 start_codon:yes stop_codon:yes gene_type:complete
MVETHLARELDIPAERVWALLEDFGDISWAPGIDKIELIGSGIGMTRRLHIKGIDPIDEVLTAQDASTMSFAYDIPRGVPMPVTNYSANAKVTALDDGRCQIDWYGRAEPQGVSDSDAVAMINGAYEMLLQWIADWFAAEK